MNLYCIQDTRTFCGNCMVFWCPNGEGYTTDLAKAWKLNEKEVNSRSWRETDKIILYTDLISASNRTVDWQAYRRLKEDDGPLPNGSVGVTT